MQYTAQQGIPSQEHHHTQQLAINKERAQFAQTEKDLESSVKKIISSLGNPDKLLSDNHCAFASQEFGRGQLGCSVQITLIYGTSGKDVGLARADSISAILKRDDSLNYVSSSSALNDIGDPSQVAVVLKDEGYRDTSTGLQCGVMYYYYTSRSQITGYPTIATVQPYIDLISLSCGGEARSQLYPLAD